MKRITVALAALLFSAGAWAFHCRRHEEDRRRAGKEPEAHCRADGRGQKYRAEGETLHKAGKHQESVDTLAKAMKILNIQ